MRPVYLSVAQPAAIRHKAAERRRRQAAVDDNKGRRIWRTSMLYGCCRVVTRHSAAAPKLQHGVGSVAMRTEVFGDKTSIKNLRFLPLHYTPCSNAK